MAKKFIYILKSELDALYNNSDTFRLALIQENTDSYVFTANAETNVFTSANNSLINNSRVKVLNDGGSLPSGLNANDTYYVVNLSGDTFQLSMSKSGTVIDINSAGTGMNTVLPQPIDIIDDQLAVLVKHEVDYQGATPRPIYNPEPAEIDYTNKIAYLPTKTLSFTPTIASVTFRYSLLIRNGTAIAGDATGTPDMLEDYGTTQTIVKNSTKGIQIAIQRKDA